MTAMIFFIFFFCVSFLIAAVCVYCDEILNKD